MIVKLLTDECTPFGVSKLKKGCRGSSKGTLVKMSNCWKSHAAAHMFVLFRHHHLHHCLQVVKMLIIVVCLFVICWMPLQIYGVLSEIYEEINK